MAGVMARVTVVEGMGTRRGGAAGVVAVTERGVIVGGLGARRSGEAGGRVEGGWGVWGLGLDGKSRRRLREGAVAGSWVGLHRC